MKTKYITILVVLVSNLIHSQLTYTGIITDTSLRPIAGVTIVDLSNPANAAMTNEKGVFSITLKDISKVSIQFIGYQTRELELSTRVNQIILEQEDILLGEVLVTTASREVQKRSDIPGAIGIVNAKNIKETKAFGIDQLVNQISGVYMSSSQAASNEQHFMAVRSPISTKALFLYLEDGLPIRPTSVFNHNALLEMNDTSFDRIEVVKGPASSIYGSEAIGGSFNFVTKDPTANLSGFLGYQTNSLGLSKYEIEVSDQPSDIFGFYLGTQYTTRANGPVAHSDYEKFATTFKAVVTLSPSLKWTSVADLIQYRSDMSGSLSEEDFRNGTYESDQSFTNRKALAFRARTTFDMHWNENTKTTANVIFRSNQMDQNPSYRIRQFRNQGQVTDQGTGEVNTNQYYSFVGLIQQSYTFDFMDSSLIAGASLDVAPQKYIAETTSVQVDPFTGKNVSFDVNTGDFILNYTADILNYAGYIQYEVSPFQALKITTAIRYDVFEYAYDNLISTDNQNMDKEQFNNWAPKLGVNYKVTKNSGLYGNYSQGFTPPQVSTLYRTQNELRDIKPSTYHNYEIGGYFNPNAKWALDFAMYLLEGKNTLITLRNEDDIFLSTNAGATRSYGIEYGVTFTPSKHLTITHNGSYARHRYIDFFDKGIEYSDSNRETAPNLLGTSIITYRTVFNKDFEFNFAATHELVGTYATSFENQVTLTDTSGETITDANGSPLTDTSTYSGHNIFGLRTAFTYKNIEIWAHALNIFDTVYAARASYNSYTKQNNYTIGTPRALHVGARLKF
ncbi:TonB-dependent receptor domain-containing protein [Aquimarina sp. W85]|uniref:TonB-dependent receptor domain-containing protein n=1 Tax=Aquimarina rhodophyticola TaxID=3342246 RepID=UPI003672255C